MIYLVSSEDNSGAVMYFQVTYDHPFSMLLGEQTWSNDCIILPEVIMNVNGFNSRFIRFPIQKQTCRNSPQSADRS